MIRFWRFVWGFLAVRHTSGFRTITPLVIHVHIIVKSYKYLYHMYYSSALIRFWGFCGICVGDY